jgi:hypothetical protein
MNSNDKIIFIREHFLNNWTEDLTRNVDHWHPHRKCKKKMLSKIKQGEFKHTGQFENFQFQSKHQ